MEEKSLVSVAIITGLAGILLLLIATELRELDVIPLSDITTNNLNALVKVEVTIQSLRATESVTILEVTDNSSSMKVIAFDAEVPVKEGDIVILTGKVIEYQDTLELEAKTIERKDVS